MTTNFVVATTIISKVAGGKFSGINMERKLRINCIVHNAHVKKRAKRVQSMTTAYNAMIYSILLKRSRKFCAI
jgi:hypothetical protein